MDKVQINETLQDFVLQGFCAGGLTLDNVIDFEPVKTRGTAGIVPPVMPAPAVVCVPLAQGRFTRDFVLSEPRSGSLNIAADAVDFAFVPDTPVRGEDLTIFAGGFQAAALGQPETWLFDTPVSVIGVRAALWGYPTLLNRNRILLPKSWDNAALGRGAVRNVSQSFTPQGLNAAQWGSLNVSPRFVYLRGTDSAAFGRSTLFNANQFAATIGLDATGWGNTRLIALRQIVPARGFDAGSVAQRTRVSERVRGLLPHGFDAADFGTTLMGGGVRTVAPPSLPLMVGYTREMGNSSGWADGEADIPVYRNINERYAVWSFGWLGTATVANRNRRVHTGGTDALTMGAAYVAEPVQTIETRGFDAAQWGYVYRWANEQTPRAWDNPVFVSWQKDYWNNKPDWTVGLTVFNDKRPIWADGIDGQAVGRALIAYDKREIVPYGFDALFMRQDSYYGGGYLVGRTEYYAFGGGDVSAFGRTAVVNTRLKQLAPAGMNAQRFGFGNVSLRKLGTLGVDTARFGSAKAGGGLFQGFDAAQWGVAWLADAVRSVSGSLNDASALGVPSLRDTRLQAASVAESGIFGDIRAVNRNRTIAAKSVEFTERVSDWTDIRLNSRRLPVSGCETVAIGKPDIELWIRTVYAGSAGKTDVFAIGMVADRVRTLHAGAFAATAFGASVWQREPVLPPQGFLAQAFGQAEIINRSRYIRTGNFEFTQMGSAAADYFSRQIRTEDAGIDAAQWGVAWSSHDRRVSAMQGWDKAAVGQAWLSFGRRTVMPAGFLAQDFRQPEMGGTQTIAPESWNNADFGNRIVPERIVFDSLLGFETTQWGQTRLFNRWQQAAPMGFELTQQFGHTALKLMRQYIHLVHNGDSGLVPPVWDGWTSIYNRNRTLSAFGIAPLRVAEPMMANAARVLAADGVDALNRGRLMTAFRVRVYRLNGIEPMRISDWHSVHNAARVLSPSGIAPDGLMQPEIKNTRRQYRWITVGDTADFGGAVIDFARRTLAPYQGVAPEYVPLPAVFNSRRFVRVNGLDAFGLGAAEAVIHWSIIAPKTHFQAAFGWADVRNVTPELHFFGKDTAEFGQPEIGLWTRYVQSENMGGGAVGVPDIADRRKTVLPAAWLSLRFGRADVWHLTTPVNYSRVIYPKAVFNPLDEFGVPDLHKNTLEVSGMAAMQFGKPSTWSNAVRVDLGVGTDGVGGPRLTLRRRVVNLHGKGILADFGVSRPVLSPMTIWCRHDAPSQARSNHKGYWYDIDGYLREKLGTPVLKMRGRQSVRARGADMADMGAAGVENRKRCLSFKGWHNGRMGWAMVGDGTQTVEAFNGTDTAAVGRHDVGFVPDIHRRVRVGGVDALDTGYLRSALWRQQIAVHGIQSAQFGSSRESRNAYMPQTLAVYFPKPVQPEHWHGAIFGGTSVSLFTRTLLPVGWDSVLSEYDLMNFRSRMRVLRGGRTIRAQTVQAQGLDAFDAAVADVSHKVRHIRPDGFMDNFRKGVANV